MLSLQKLSLTHFKNYDFSSFLFTKKVVGISGLNGRGKTNLLDAIYYCCFTKSYFSNSDALNINFDKDGFRLEAVFEKNDETQKIVCINRGISKKEFYINDVPLYKLAGHIGSLPAVIIAPDDIDIIIGGSEGRRRYLDSVICQLDNEYLQQLMLYNKVLLQRNSLLKRFAEKGFADIALLEIINGQLITPGDIVYRKRNAYCQQLMPMAETFYNNIAGNDETIKCSYSSQLHNENFEDLLGRTYERDRILLRTGAGIHKDEVNFELNNQPFKTTASQGQRKSLLFALKLAQYELLKKYKSYSPVLLLDDVFEKLDEQRMHRLLMWVCKENDGQVFITDTHKKRLEAAFGALEIDGQMVEL